MAAPLPFETEIHALEDVLKRLEQGASATANMSEEIKRIRRELSGLLKKTYSSLTPWQTVLVSRHPERPQTMDYVSMIFEEFVELRGDRAFGDDQAIRCGFARLGNSKVLLVGHQKGHTLKERQACYYGCAHPEGYRKALNKMKLAAKFHLPIICLIDTPGAFPGIGAEERGQAQLIATSILEMSRLPTPIVCVVIGEGGSGGALGIGVGDRIAVLEHAYYSVISPEGCAGILWKVANEETKPRAAEALRLTSKHLASLGVIDDVLHEPLGGAHREPREMGTTLKSYLLRSIRELKTKKLDRLLDERYNKFRKMGVFLEPREASGGKSS
ncbi:MAG: acetyl-CoA carboxylase carboxyltransferase subunit alpha [Gemmataceae bacterium]|nr:acetyl-CoA carboxylase carboxyltransferase subunit alpha [Gemmataceae bacterium]